MKKKGWVLEHSKNIQTSDLLKTRKSPELLVKTKQDSEMNSMENYNFINSTEDQEIISS
jgi:hypothetical protein